MSVLAAPLPRLITMLLDPSFSPEGLELAAAGSFGGVTGTLVGVAEGVVSGTDLLGEGSRESSTALVVVPTYIIVNDRYYQRVR